MLRTQGHECELQPKLIAAELPAAAVGIDVLIVRSTRVEAAVFEQSDVRLVIRAGAGYNTIDVMAAADRGVYVCNVPGKNAVAVAELAFGLLLALDRNIPDNVTDLRAGTWHKSRYQRAAGLYGRAVGVVGIGAIGLAFAERARSFGMAVHAVAKPSRSAAAKRRLDALGVIYHPDLHALAAACDVLSFHVPGDPTTKGLIGRELLARVRPGTFLINTSRGDLVDEEALLAALDEKKLRAGLDVFVDEPAAGEAEFVSVLAQHPNVYGTHHIGASTSQAQHAVADEVVEIVASFQAGEIRNCVNLAAVRGSTTLVVRHDNEVGVLAGVLGALGRAGISVEQVENRLFAGGRAAAVAIQLGGSIDAALRAEIEALQGVIGVSAEPR